MLLGAIYLAVRAYLLSSYDCDAALSPEECGLEREVVTEMSKLFYFCSVGLLLVGSGVFLLFRKKPGAA